MTLSTTKSDTKEIKKKVYLSKNKKILLELIKQDNKDKNKDGND
jgi:hypothetical protein